MSVGSNRVIASFDTDSAFQTIKEAVIARTGLAYYADKDDNLARSIRSRMDVLGLADFAYYLDNLNDLSNVQEWASLIDEITIGETYFFRDKAQFGALRELVLPDCISRRQAERRLKIWCAGCSTGPEPYSISILLRDYLSDLIRGWDISVLGTDISPAKLERAKAGDFNDWELRGMNAHDREAYFEHSGRAWRLRSKYKAGVSFQTLNLVHDAASFAARSGETFDVIMCRNVMIYFDIPLIRSLLRTLHAALSDGGWLVVGHAEPHFEVSNFFRPHPVTGAMLYRKRVDEVPLAAMSAKPEMVGPVLDEFFPIPRRRPVHTPDRPRRALQPAAPARIPPSGPETAPLTDVRELANAGEWAGAADACHRALEAEPLDADAYYLLALILEHTGDTVQASAALRRAIYIDGNFALAHYHLACRSATGHDASGATRFLRNVVASLEGVDDTSLVRAGDGMTAGELRECVRMQFRSLQGVV